MRRPLVLTLAAALCVALLVGCDAADEPAPGPDASSTPAPGPDPTQPAATTTLHLAGADVKVDVLPVVRVGEHAVLTLDLTMPETGGDPAFLASALGGTGVLRLPSLAGLRLVDLERDVVHTVAVDTEGDAVTSGHDFIALDPGTTMRLQTAYAAPPAGSGLIGVFVPGGPYVPAVPVVDGELPPLDLPGDQVVDPTAPLDLGRVAEAPVAELEAFTAELEGAVETLTSTEEVRVTLGADVLFAVDSAELTSRARDALDAAAAHLADREPGTVLVVGHTDDVASDAYNQELSERRAAAVAAELGRRIDTTRFTLRTEGRGEAEPVVANTDDEARARNRRVTVTLTSTTTTTTEVTTKGELPPFEGPVGTGEEGVVVDSAGRYRITAPQARLVDGHVVVDLRIEPLDEGARAGVAFLSGVWHYRGDAWTVQRSASGLVMLRGGTAVYPTDHVAGVSDDGHEQWLPLTDLETLGVLTGPRTFSVVYPDVGPLDEVAVQVGAALGVEPFRLTDIPVRPPEQGQAQTSR